MEELENILRGIHQRNSLARAEASQLSARLQSITLSGDHDAIDRFDQELEERYRGLLEVAEQDPAVGRTDGSQASPEDG